MKFFECFSEMQWNYFQQRLPSLKKLYKETPPFPHIVLDDFFNPLSLMEAEENFPKPDKNWWKYDNFMERKWAKDNLEFEHESIRGLIHNLQDKPFVKFLEVLTGISGLITDCNLNGGGLHQITKGGKLDIHIDYNYHPLTKLDRRLNVLVYLNYDWKEEWNGALELWSPDMRECVQRIYPTFNRMAVFSTTENSNHGHPEPLECPVKITRKSLALYYYSNGRPEYERRDPHSTIYKKRPQDEDDPEKEEMRQLRAIRRLQ